jgi:glucokinase
VSWERLLSGPGLANIYRFLVEEAGGDGFLLDDPDPAAAISAAAQGSSDALATRALDLFVRVLGRQAGNLALTVVSTGGIYLAGGIAPRILWRLERPDFLEALCEKGRLSPLLQAMPVRVITTPDAGLLGAAAAA